MLRCCVAVQVQAALERVRAGADVMPRAQLEGVLVSELGADWHTRLAEFEWEPRAAASIGQVRGGAADTCHSLCGVGHHAVGALPLQSPVVLIRAVICVAKGWRSRLR